MKKPDRGVEPLNSQLEEAGIHVSEIAGGPGYHTGGRLSTAQFHAGGPGSPQSLRGHDHRGSPRRVGDAWPLTSSSR